MSLASSSYSAAATASSRNTGTNSTPGTAARKDRLARVSARTCAGP
jgi:hypothetical protein